MMAAGHPACSCCARTVECSVACWMGQGGQCYTGLRAAPTRRARAPRVLRRGLPRAGAPVARAAAAAAAAVMVAAAGMAMTAAAVRAAASCRSGSGALVEHRPWRKRWRSSGASPRAGAGGWAPACTRHLWPSGGRVHACAECMCAHVSACGMRHVRVREPSSMPSWLHLCRVPM